MSRAASSRRTLGRVVRAMSATDAAQILTARVAHDPNPAWKRVVRCLGDALELSGARPGDADSNAEARRDALCALAASLIPLADALDAARQQAEAFKASSARSGASPREENGTNHHQPARRALAGESRGVARGVSWTSPRGKYDAHAMKNGDLVLENAKGAQIVIARGMIRRVLELPTGDANGTSLVALGLSGEGVENGKSRLTTLCASFRGKDKITIDGASAGEEGDDRAASRIFFDFLRQSYGDDACGTTNPKKTFAGSKGLGHVQATKGFNSGYLFFLDEGVAFGPSPAMYVHFDDLEDLKVLRADNAGSSTFDLSMTSESGVAMEFTNISRDELEHVSRYLAKRCTSADDPPTAADLARAIDKDDEDDESDEDDEDFTGQERESGSDEDDGDDDEDDGNDMEYSYDDSDEARGEKDGSDSETSDEQPLVSGKRRRVDAPQTAPAHANDSESDSESDDNAFQVVRG